MVPIPALWSRCSAPATRHARGRLVRSPALVDAPGARSVKFRHCDGSRSLAGMAGIDIPYVETGVALSAPMLGALIALRVKMPIAAAAGLVGFFAIFHGYAHGAEMPETASSLAYALGFVAATAIATGVATPTLYSPRALEHGPGGKPAEACRLMGKSQIRTCSSSRP